MQSELSLYKVQRLVRDTISENNSNGSSGLSLAERLRSGSASAWHDLVTLYGPLLDRWCRTANVPSHAVADIAQDVFLSAFQGLARFDSRRPDATFRGWLWTITRSRIVEYHRRQKGRQAAVGGSTAQQIIQSVIDPLPLEDPTEPDQAAALLHRALEQIRGEFTASSWDYFWRATVLGHPTDLIAREHQVTPGAVRQARSRILRRLRSQLSCD